MQLTLGTLYRETGGNKVYWCDNYAGTLVLRHVQNSDVLNGVFDGPLNPISAPTDLGAELISFTFLAKSSRGSEIYLIDNYDGTWKKRYISNMTVFRNRHFKEGTVETVRWNVLEGMSNGTRIDSPS